MVFYDAIPEVFSNTVPLAIAFSYALFDSLPEVVMGYNSCLEGAIAIIF